MDNTLHNLYAARFCAAEAVTALSGGFDDSTFSHLLFYILNRDTPTLIPEAVSAYLHDIGDDRSSEGYIRLYEVLENACIRPYEDLVRLARFLKDSGVTVGIISNADTKTTARRIAELGLCGVFDIVVNPETFGVKKPDARVYQKTLEVLGIDASRAVMIGDKLDRDIFPARAAGLFAIHVWFGSLDAGGDCMMAKTQEDVWELLGLPKK